MGGVAILAAVYLAGIAAVLRRPDLAALWSLGIAGAVLACVAYVDDRRPLPASFRALVHLAVAGALAISGLYLTEIDLPGFDLRVAGWLGVTVTIGLMAWMINLYNFMDGMDGFAGGMTVSGFATLSALGWLAGHPDFALVSAVIAASAVGFLVCNFPPARIFMGDVGSSTLGLFAAGFVVWGVRERMFPLWCAILIFSPFIVDATVTLVRRLVRGERIWEPHRTHYYQRLVRAGWGHRRTVLLQYAFMLGCSVSAVVGVHASEGMQWAIIVGWTLIYGTYFLGVNRLEARVGSPA
ncbi:MraY family glycosyltransferase [Sulfurifustis variabilis]